MSRFVNHLRPGALLVALVLIPIVAPPGPAEAQTPGPHKVTSSVGEVSSHRFADGSAGNLGYKVSTEVHETVAPGESLPTVRVDAAEHPDAFAGQWADQGLHAAWVSPRTEYQFFPEASSIESAYFDNVVESDGVPLVPGDRFDVAVKHLPFDTPLTWGRKRAEADGELGWDVATKVHRVAATYGENSSEMEVMFVRADLVARGGDFDARDSSVDLPPLVIDLPRSYGPEVTVGAASAQFAPYLHYIRNLEGQVLGQAGKAVFTADLRGYLPEAREYKLANGNTIREWHIPLDIIITAVGRTGQAGAASALSMPADGVVKTFGGLAPSVTRAPAGSTVITGTDLPPQVRQRGGEGVTSEAPVASTGEEGGPERQGSAGGGTQLDEFLDLAPIDHTLDEPTTVKMAKRTFELTVDPDLYGSGSLGIGARHLRTQQDFFASAAATSVTVDGHHIPLDRSRLVELRIAPQIDGIRLRFTGRSDGDALLDPASYSRAREGWIHDPGLNLEAVYDLGDGLFAFYSAYAFAEDGGIDTYLSVRSLKGTIHSLNATQYIESADGRTFTYGGAPLTHETSGASAVVAADGITLSGGASGGGVMTIKRAADEILAAPVADPSIALAGAPIGIYISSSGGVTSDAYFSRASSWLRNVTPEARFDLPPIGEPCTEPVVVDDDEADADPPLDISRAWFDHDGATIAATIEVSSLSEDALAPGTYRAGWRHDHIGYGLQATRDATGAWKFDLGLHPSAGANWSRIATATGEVSYGSPGYIRITAPAETSLGPRFLDGEILHDTGAVSYGATLPVAMTNSVADRVPDGAPEYAFGRGGSWTIAPCPGATPPLAIDLLDAPFEVQHSDAFTVRAQVLSGDSPSPDESVTFTFGGEQRSVTTDGEGIATATFVARDVPGEYPLRVSTGAEPEVVFDEATVAIGKEDTALALEVTGKGAKRTLTATLADADTPSDGIEGRTIVFFADGETIGSARTDAAGIATLKAPPRYRGGTHSFEAAFDGDEVFLSSNASTVASDV